MAQRVSASERESWRERARVAAWLRPSSPLIGVYREQIKVHALHGHISHLVGAQPAFIRVYESIWAKQPPKFFCVRHVVLPAGGVAAAELVTQPDATDSLIRPKVWFDLGHLRREGRTPALPEPDARLKDLQVPPLQVCQGRYSELCPGGE